MEILVAVLFIAVLVAIFAGVVTLLVVVGRQRRRNRADLVALAQQRGWTYRPSDTGTADRFTGGEPFPQWGRNIRVSDLITGQHRDRPFTCFEYRRRTPNPGRRSRTDRQRPEHFQVFAVPLPAPGPTLQVRRAGWGSRMLDKIGAGGIAFNDPEFDAAFRVTGDDEAFAHEVLTGGLRRWLLADQRSHDLPLRFAGNELVAWRRARLTAPAVDPALDFLNDVLDRVRPARWHAAR